MLVIVIRVLIRLIDIPKKLRKISNEGMMVNDNVIETTNLSIKSIFGRKIRDIKKPGRKII